METMQDVVIPACSPRPMNQHSLHYQQWVRGLGTAEPRKSSWVCLAPGRSKGHLCQERGANGLLEMRLLLWSWVIPLLFSHRLAKQAPGSCRWREVLPLIAGMSERCEKPERFCLLKLPALSPTWQASGDTHSYHLGRLLIPLGNKRKHAETQVILSRTLHLERKERNPVCKSLTAVGFAGSLPPQEQPCKPSSALQGCCCCSSWAAGCKHPRKQKPLASHGQPSVPLLPGLLGPAKAVKHHFYVLPTLLLKHWVHLTEWIPTADGLHRQCPVHLPSSQRKYICRYFSIADKLLLSRFSFHFFLAPRGCRSHPGARTAALWVCLVNLGNDELVKGPSGLMTWVGVDVFHLEELEIFSVQRKKPGTKDFSCFFLYSESHLPITELCFGATDGLPFTVQQTAALAD